MTSITNHLIRRGVEGMHSSLGKAGDDGSKEQLKFSAWGMTAIVVTLLVFAFGQFAIEYTYGVVIATLAAVEAPSSTAIIRTPPEGSLDSERADTPLLSGDEKHDVKEPQNQEILLIKQRALTSRFCTIRRHLKARAGRGSRFRGLPVYGLTGLLLSMIMGCVSVFIRPHSLTYTFAQIGAFTLLTPFELLLNHIIISEPSQKPWSQRMAPRAIIKKALLPTLLYASISEFTTQSFIHGCVELRILPSSSAAATAHDIPLTTIILALIGAFIFIAIQISAKIGITRVRASLLSSEEEPIIPFDRTFNGQVVPEEQGGKGMLDLWAAWTGCDMQTRMRVLGVYAKTLAMQLSWMLLGALVLVGEMRLMLGPDFAEKLSLDVLVRA